MSESYRYKNALLFNTYLDKYSIIVSALCVLMQFIIDPSVSNIISSLIIFTSLKILLNFKNKYSLFYTKPLIYLVLLGFNISSQTGALLAKTFYLEPLIENLDAPIKTFGYSALFQATIYFSIHILINSPSLVKFSRFLRQRVFKPCNVFSLVKVRQLWIMGIIGFFALIMQLKYVGTTESVEYGDVGGKFIQGFIYFVNIPFIIVIYKYTFKDYKVNKYNNYFLILYFILLLITALSLNGRYFIFAGITNIMLLSFLYMYSGVIRVTKTVLKKAALLFTAILIVSPIFSDLAYAMVIARLNRDVADISQMISTTLAIYGDKAQIANMKELEVLEAKVGGYSEAYIDNPMLNRFISTKYADNIFRINAAKVDANKDLITDFSFNKITSFFPTPIVRLFSNVDKNDVLIFSIGDLFYSIEFGPLSPSLRVGSTVAHSFQLFGILYLIILIPVVTLLLLIVDSLELITDDLVIVATPLLCGLTVEYFMFCGDGLHDLMGLIVRYIPQAILLYFFIFKIS